ncbi:MAG: ABC transporter substrate-binding protein, partial [Chloroflexota bacterium]
MNKRILWSALSGLMALSLLIAACAPAATPTTPTAPTAPTTPTTPTAPKTEKPPQEPVKPDIETPKYGGTFNFLQTTEILNFDPAIGASPAFGLTNDTLTQSDWTKGPAGTGENDFMHLVPDLKGVTGSIVESWQIPEVGTFIFKIRRGIRYGLNPASEASRLVNGRELTAADIVFTIKRNATSPAAAIYLAKPEMSRAMTINETAPWQVTVKMPVDPWGGVERILYGVGGSNSPQPPEVVQKYGNMNNWKNSVGAGAWILTDFVSGSVATLSKNPNYWETDPIGPGKGNQLPYVDTVKLLILRDVSTQLAALRTGKVDISMNVIATDAGDLRKTAPRLKFKNRTQNYPLAIGMRLDKPGLPYQDIRVRQA